MLILRVEPVDGETVEDTIRAMIALAARLELRVACTVNGVPVTVAATDQLEHELWRYEQAQRERGGETVVA